ncbi:hypothetical protein PVAP13_3KG127701, partial [Panicum virgatum]
GGHGGCGAGRRGWVAEEDEAGRLQDNALHTSERDLRPLRHGRLQRQPDHVPHAAAAPAARGGLQPAHQLQRHGGLHAGPGRHRRRLLRRPLLDHRGRRRAVPARHAGPRRGRASPGAPPRAVRRRRLCHGGGAPVVPARMRRAARHAVPVAAPHRARRRRHPALRGGVRRRPVRPAPRRRPEVELLQPLLLQHGARRAAGAHHRGVPPGERGVGMGVRDPGHRHVPLRAVVRGRVPALRESEARGKPLQAAAAGPRRRLQEEEGGRAGGRRLALPQQGARRPHRRRREAAAHRSAKVIGPSGRGDDGRRRRLRRAAPVARVDGAPRGGAQIHRPHAAPVGGQHHAHRRGVAQLHLRHPAGAHHGPPPHRELPDPAGHHDHLHHALHARQPRALRPRPRAPRAPLHGAAVGHHLLPAHGRPPRRLRPGRHGRRARGGQAARRGRRARSAGQARRRRARQRVLAGAAVRAPRRERRALDGGPHGVPIRPVTGEHAQLGGGALLGRRLPRELPGHGARGGGAERQRRGVAPGQHQPGEAGLLLLARHLPPGAQSRLLHRVLPFLHLEIVRGRRRRRAS